MEGLIPLIYRVIIQYRTGEQLTAEGSMFNEPLPAPYARLPGDSGRFKLPPEYSSFFSMNSPSTSSDLIVSKGIKSPLHLSVG
ncbi:Uncharacterized protein TCM_041758 [Theobroma cacao]|uniref:Uncharacterized protein n=1 Tax=Theobroma cacao TaxID=3641 RepID=A0A061GXJ5_THECC|nr:Uncharacterized protein TCM_041758 [Theobroma cacao]